MNKQSRTTLTEWFANNAKEITNPLSNEERGYDKDNKLYPTGPELHYNEYPQFYTWDKNSKIWQRRKAPKKSKTVGRVHVAHPGQGERYYLRILVHHIVGATSFEDLKVFKGKVHKTFLDACKARDLLEDDSEYHATLTDASIIESGLKLRNLFVILVHCTPINSFELWDQHKTELAEDFLYEFQCKQNNFDLDYND